MLAKMMQTLPPENRSLFLILSESIFVTPMTVHSDSLSVSNIGISVTLVGYLHSVCVMAFCFLPICLRPTAK